MRESLPAPVVAVWGAPGRYPERKGPPAASLPPLPSRPAPPLAAVPSPTPQALAPRADPRHSVDARGTWECVSACPPCTPAHRAGENARRRIADTAQPRGLGDPGPRPGVSDGSRVRSRRVLGQLPGEEGGAPWGLQIHDPSHEAGRVEGGDDGLGVQPLGARCE